MIRPQAYLGRCHSLPAPVGCPRCCPSARLATSLARLGTSNLSCLAAGNGGNSGIRRKKFTADPGDDDKQQQPGTPGAWPNPWDVIKTHPAAPVLAVLGVVMLWRLHSDATTERLDTSSSSVAVIVPALNEAKGLAATLQMLQELQPPVAEILVVDGGSSDATVKVAKGIKGVRVLRSERGRAAQMNAGAAAATSSLLCFLHADSRPPKDLVAVLRREFSDPRTVLTGFLTSIEVPGHRLWLMNFHQFIKAYYPPLIFRPLSFVRGLRLLFGDQTLCCRAADLKRVGGFDSKWLIMEDADLCVRMHEAGPAAVVASPAAARAAAAGAVPPGAALAAAAAAAGRQAHDPATARGTRRGRSWQSSSSSSDSSSSGAASPWDVAVNYAQCWRRPRGSVKQILDRVNVTSGRRIVAWGGLKSTAIHVIMTVNWYFGRDPQQLAELYHSLYGDSFR